MQSIQEINAQIQAKLITEASVPTQIMDQDKFNFMIISKLNELSLIYSKGKRKFTITPENEHLFSVLFCYLNRNSDPSTLQYTFRSGEETETVQLDLTKGLVLMGNVGVGKTLLMRSIHSLMPKMDLTGRFTTSRIIFETKKPDMITVVGQDKYGLFIDDLGDEPIKSVDYGNEDTPVANVLKQRMDNWEKLPESPKLFITSNCRPELLEKIYGPRIVSRMYASCNVIKSSQKQDFRKS